LKRDIHRVLIHKYVYWTTRVLETKLSESLGKNSGSTITWLPY